MFLLLLYGIIYFVFNNTILFLLKYFLPSFSSPPPSLSYFLLLSSLLWYFTFYFFLILFLDSFLVSLSSLYFFTLFSFMFRFFSFPSSPFSPQYCYLLRESGIVSNLILAKYISCNLEFTLECELNFCSTFFRRTWDCYSYIQLHWHHINDTCHYSSCRCRWRHHSLQMG